jgi:DNA-binding NarL/FixJ family response regulator
VQVMVADENRLIGTAAPDAAFTDAAEPLAMTIGASRSREDPAMSPRVVLVEANAIFRRGLRVLLESEGLEVSCEVSDGRAALESVETKDRDVVLMDVTTPEGDNIGAIRAILAANAGARVLAVALSPDDDAVMDALEAGACGCLLRSAEAADILAAVWSAAAGEVVICPAVAARLLPYLSRGREIDRRAGETNAQLTAREREILSLITKGRENPHIAQELCISPYTVKNHVASILSKLGTDNRVAAAVMAVRAGWA